MRRISTRIMCMGVHLLGEFSCSAPDDLAGGWFQSTTMNVLGLLLESESSDVIELVRRHGAHALSFETSIGPIGSGD